MSNPNQRYLLTPAPAEQLSTWPAYWRGVITGVGLGLILAMLIVILGT